MVRRSRLVAGIGGAATAVGLLAVQFTGGWEGLRLAAYQDVVGVWTACYGETRGIRPGMKFTQDKCDSMFIASLTEHEAGMRACLKAPDTIPDRTYVALVSFTYNVGTDAFCRSTLRRLANAGNLKAACEQLPRWNRAGGKVVRGLVNRRATEMELCLSGLSAGTVTNAPRPQQKPADPAIKMPGSPGAGDLPIGLLLAAGIVDRHNGGERVIWAGNGYLPIQPYISRMSEQLAADFWRLGVNSEFDTQAQFAWLTNTFPGSNVGYWGNQGVPAFFLEEVGTFNNETYGNNLIGHRQFSEHLTLRAVETLLNFAQT